MAPSKSLDVTQDASPSRPIGPRSTYCRRLPSPSSTWRAKAAALSEYCTPEIADMK